MVTTMRASQRIPAFPVRSDDRPPSMKVFGHGTTTGPGHAINSRESFVELASLGVDGVELDVRLTVDGALVVIHDDHYSDGRLISKTPAEDRPPDVIRLADALELCRGLDVNIELKNHPREATFDPEEQIAERCVELLDKRGGSDDVLISCFGLGCIDRVRELRPATPTAILLLSRRPVDEVLTFDASQRHRTAHPYLSMVDEAFMSRARQLGLRVNVWSAGDESEGAVQSMIELGVDGLITESPRRAMRLRGDS